MFIPNNIIHYYSLLFKGKMVLAIIIRLASIIK